MFTFIYIGQNNNIRLSISDIVKQEVKCFCNVYDFTEHFIYEIKENYCVIFYDSCGIESDKTVFLDLKMYFEKTSKCIKYSIILISDNLLEVDKVAYLKLGVSNVISSPLDKQQVKSTLDFIQNRQKISSDNNISNTEVKLRLPLWKRIFDIVLSLIIIICFSPIYIIIAIAIKIESRGPVIYKSKRVGSNYHVFDFLKFRSMYDNSEQKLIKYKKLNKYDGVGEKISENNDEALNDEIIANNQPILVSDDYIIPENKFLDKKNEIQNNSFVKLENDPRITKVGRIIRKYSIDELPQFFNILKGDMSLVGNRPLPLYEAELLTTDDYIDRFMAPAGLTGLWQVMKRGKEGKMSAEERKQLDIKYAKTYSFRLDMKIILKTFTAFIQKDDV